MVDFDFTMHGLEGVDDSLAQSIDGAPGQAEDELVKVAEDIKEEIEDTAPVDTGEYREGWEIQEVDDNLVLLVNDVEHAPHVVFPNPVMQGSDAADDPAAGILHDVRSIVVKHRDEVESGWASRITSWLGL